MLLALTLLQWLLERANRAAQWPTGLLFRLRVEPPGLWWIHISMTAFGGIPLPVAFLDGRPAGRLSWRCLPWPPAGCGLVCSHHPSDWLDGPRLLAFPALWLLGDWAMGHVLTGFPWLWFGYSQIDSPLVGIAPLLGVQGITLALLLSSGALLLTLQTRKPLWLLLPLALFAAGAGLQTINWTRAGKPLNFALMQANIAQEAKWDPKSIRPTLLRYLDMSRDHQDADVIVWPESAVPALENEMQEFLANLDGAMREHHTGF